MIEKFLGIHAALYQSTHAPIQSSENIYWWEDAGSARNSPQFLELSALVDPILRNEANLFHFQSEGQREKVLNCLLSCAPKWKKAWLVLICVHARRPHPASFSEVGISIFCVSPQGNGTGAEAAHRKWQYLAIIKDFVFLLFAPFQIVNPHRSYEVCTQAIQSTMVPFLEPHRKRTFAISALPQTRKNVFFLVG